MRILLALVFALFVACGGGGDAPGGSGEKPSVPEPTTAQGMVEDMSEDRVTAFVCAPPPARVVAPAPVAEPEESPWYGAPLDLAGPVRVGFDATVPEAARPPLREAIAWIESISDGFEFVWVADTEPRDIGFTVDETLGVGGYCTGCCNGAARTAEIIIGTVQEGHEDIFRVVGIHEVGHALGLTHILPDTWRSVMNRAGPFDPASPYADGALDAQLICALNNDALGCFVGDEAAREARIGLGFQHADGPACEGWVPPVPPETE